MVQKINVGLQKKIGQPNFGSLAASCHFEVLFSDEEAFDERLIASRIKHAFSKCRESIDEELAGCSKAQQDSTKVHVVPDGRDAEIKKRATEAQVRAICGIASKHKVSLASELNQRFGVRSPDDLTLRQASQMIDQLKQWPVGVS